MYVLPSIIFRRDCKTIEFDRIVIDLLFLPALLSVMDAEKIDIVQDDKSTNNSYSKAKIPTTKDTYA